MRIAHSRGTYEVRFESANQAIASLPADVRVVTDQNVVERQRSALGDLRFIYAVPEGETSKSMETLAGLLSWMSQTRASRKTTICAFGGGVVGDLAGFAAAVYMRGVPFVQIPTSLLAQVDSSVGGKVGVDLPEGKNLAGAFYPPSAVSICTDLLTTLPDNQFRNGMAEVWKYGFIMDRGLVEILGNANLNAGHPIVPEIVHRCIALKARVVQEDEYETNGLRAILNYGHTVGHAIEFITGYGTVLHGEAVSIGMVVEARLGELLGLTPIGTGELVAENLSRSGLPVYHEAVDGADRLIAAMYGDKKSVAGNLAFSLLKDIGECRLVEGVEESAVREALRDTRPRARS